MTINSPIVKNDSKITYASPLYFVTQNSVEKQLNTIDVIPIPIAKIVLKSKNDQKSHAIEDKIAPRKRINDPITKSGFLPI